MAMQAEPERRHRDRRGSDSPVNSVVGDRVLPDRRVDADGRRRARADEQHPPEDQLERVPERALDHRARPCSRVRELSPQSPRTNSLEPVAVLDDDGLVEPEPLASRGRSPRGRATLRSSSRRVEGRRGRTRRGGTTRRGATGIEYRIRRSDVSRAWRHRIADGTRAGGPAPRAEPPSQVMLSRSSPRRRGPTRACSRTARGSGCRRPGRRSSSLHSRMLGSGSSGSEPTFSARSVVGLLAGRLALGLVEAGVDGLAGASSSPGMFVRVQFWPELPFAARRDVLRAEQVAVARVERR